MTTYRGNPEPRDPLERNVERRSLFFFFLSFVDGARGLSLGSNLGSGTKDAALGNAFKKPVAIIGFLFLFLISHIRKVLLVSVILYVVGHILTEWASPDCMGWDCKEVYCPAGYAVQVPGGYLPCDKFDDYINGNKEVIR